MGTETGLLTPGEGKMHLRKAIAVAPCDIAPVEGAKPHARTCAVKLIVLLSQGLRLKLAWTAFAVCCSPASWADPPGCRQDWIFHGNYVHGEWSVTSTV